MHFRRCSSLRNHYITMQAGRTLARAYQDEDNREDKFWGNEGKNSRKGIQRKYHKHKFVCDLTEHHNRTEHLLLDHHWGSIRRHNPISRHLQCLRVQSLQHWKGPNFIRSSCRSTNLHPEQHQLGTLYSKAVVFCFYEEEK